MDACAGTFSVAKACMILPNHRRIMECGWDPSYVIEAEPQLILLYARQVFSKEPDIDGEEKASTSAEEYDKTMKTIEVRRRLDE